MMLTGTTVPPVRMALSVPLVRLVRRVPPVPLVRRVRWVRRDPGVTRVIRRLIRRPSLSISPPAGGSVLPPGHTGSGTFMGRGIQGGTPIGWWRQLTEIIDPPARSGGLISYDRRYVSFTKPELAANGEPVDGTPGVRRRDRQTGTTVKVSGDGAGELAGSSSNALRRLVAAPSTSVGEPRAHRGEHHDLNFPRSLAVRYRRCRQPVAHRRDVTRPRLSPCGSMRGLSAGPSRQRVSRGFHRELAERQGDALRTTGRREERAARPRGAHDRPCQARLPPCRVIAPTISRSLRRSPPAFRRSYAARRSARAGAPPDRGWWDPHRTPRPPRGP